ncbi:MAG: RluA family pseudouridine synthase [Acutalibacteraceae bacterium]|nr:RluA family pseudouridine synthase [Acutalibacteraceae bacterium]
MKEFIIKSNDAGQRLDKFISKAMPLLPTTLMYKYIRTKHIKVNGKRAEINTRLCEGDKICAFISDEFFGSKEPKYDFMSASDKLNIVYEDENILLANKPQGLLSHPDENEYNDTLITRIQKYLYEKGEYNPESENSFKPSLANRIDRNTGGIVIAAKNAAALRILCDKIKTREIDKRYLTVVHGIPKEKEALLEGFLEKNQDKNKVYLQKKKTDNNLSIRTYYKTLAVKNNLSLLEIQLLTGRTHQIRAHMASIGHALLGDGKYGSLKEDKKLGFTKQALYSYKLTFSFESDADILNYLKDKTFALDSVWFAEEIFGYKIK